jgi:hypothetical protein
MLDKPKDRRVVTAGLLAGTVMFAVGAAFHLLISRFVGLPYGQPPFRPWCGWTFLYMVVHPFWFGFAFAWLFIYLEPQTQSVRTGARFGALLFLVGAIPIYLVTFASIAMPWRVIVCWIIQSFTEYVLAGAALGLRGIRPRVNNAGLSSGAAGLACVHRQRARRASMIGRRGSGARSRAIRGHVPVSRLSACSPRSPPPNASKNAVIQMCACNIDQLRSWSGHGQLQVLVNTRTSHQKPDVQT